MGAVWLDLGEYRGPGRAHALVGFMIERRRRAAVDAAWRSYVADSLQNIPQNRFLTNRFADLVQVREEVDVEATIDRVAALVDEINAQGGEDE